MVSRTDLPGEQMVTGDVGGDATRCTECVRASVAGSPNCEGHLRGHTYFLLDRARWPRLQIGSTSIAGDDAWRVWLRAAKPSDLLEVSRLTNHRTANSSWAEEREVLDVA